METDDSAFQIEITNSTSRRIPVRRIRSLIAYVLRRSRSPRAKVLRRRRAAGDAGRRLAYVELAVVGDAAMRTLNRRWLNRNRTSDVLSFDLSDGDGLLWAQIVVNVEQARRQARLRGRGYGAELMLYVVHGLLHLLGYDDADPDQARRMHAREDQLLRQFGVGAVYADGAPGPVPGRTTAGRKRAGGVRCEKPRAGKRGAFDRDYGP